MFSFIVVLSSVHKLSGYFQSLGAGTALKCYYGETPVMKEDDFTNN